jgi:hypothetical protein
MPGLGVITQRVTGETIDAVKYNGDRQELVTMMEPSQIDDDSPNPTQMQVTVDPGEVGSESLAANLAGEIERLRFAIKEIRGTPQWYTTTKTTTKIIPFTGFGTADGSSLAADSIGKISGHFIVPDDYASGQIVFSWLHRPNAAGGAFKLQHQGFRFRDATALLVWIDADASGSIPDLNSHLITRAINATDFVVGDSLRLDIIRVGTDVADTNTGALNIDGIWVTYLSYAGR